MLERLNGGVVVVFVDLTINSLCGLLGTHGLDVLIRYSRADGLMNVGGLAMLRGEALDGCLRFLHCDGCYGWELRFCVRSKDTSVNMNLEDVGLVICRKVRKC